MLWRFVDMVNQNLRVVQTDPHALSLVPLQIVGKPMMNFGKRLSDNKASCQLGQIGANGT